MLRRIKRILVYFIFAASLAALVMAFSPSWLRAAYQDLFRSTSIIRYDRTAANKAGFYWASGELDGQRVLVRGRLGKSAERIVRCEEIGLGHNDQFTHFFTCSDGSLLLVVEREDGGRGIYLLDKSQNELTSLLPLRPEQSVSAFAEEDGNVTFAVDNGITEAIWEYELGHSWLVQKNKLTRVGEPAMLAFSDCSTIRQDGGRFLDSDIVTSAVGIPVISHCWYTPENLWYLDDMTGVVWKAPLARSAVSQFSLSQVQEACGKAAVDINISDAGILVLTENGGLYRWQGLRAGFEDLSASLLPSKSISVAIVAVSILLVLLLAVIPWYLVCEYQKMHVSIVFRSGVFLLLMVVLLASSIYQWVSRPYYRGITEDWMRQVLQAAGRAPEAVDEEFSTLWFEKEDSTWYLTRDGQRLRMVESLMYGRRFTEGPELAQNGEETLVRYYENGDLRVAWFMKDSTGRVIAMTVDDEVYEQKYKRGCRETLMATVPFCFIIWLLLVLILTDYSDRIQRIANGLNSIESGHINHRVVDNYGDEISSLADSVNTVAAMLETGRRNDVSTRSGYASFLPDQLISLLNVQNVEDIDRDTFMQSEKTTLHVSLVFDKSIYEEGSHKLFDCVNEVIGRTAEHISKNNGIILSFSYDGYDAAFPPDSSDAVSAVVSIRQEALAINEEHRRRGLPEMKLQATLDVGELMAGVVGSSTRMQVVALSSSLNRARMLSKLFEQLDANVLCTEKVAMQAEGFHSRYIGKLCGSSEEVRVYELYEGDESALRTEKEEHARLFAEGVYLFYAGNYSKAKRIFMNIVRVTPKDGVARHYLYLADRFEKEPPEKAGLDSGLGETERV